MNLLLTAAALLLVGLALWCFIRLKYGSNVPALPGALPLIGHTLVILSNMDRILDWQLAACQQMSFKTFYFTMQATAFYMVADPTCLEYILRTHSDSFIKGPLCNKAGLLGGGIMNSDGEQWLWQHKLARHIIKDKRFKRCLHSVLSARLGTLLQRLHQSAADGTQVDLQQLLRCLSFDALCEVMLSVNVGSLTAQQQVPEAAALDSAQMVIDRRFMLPCWWLIQLLDGSRSQLMRDKRTLRQFAAQAINKHGQQPAGAQSQISPKTLDSFPCDMLSLYLGAAELGGQPLDQTQLLDTVVNFLVAGRDTTAQAVCWTICHLLQHPDCEGQLVAELQRVLADTQASYHGLTDDILKQLHYTRACYLEALRLNPPVPLGVRYATEHHELPDGSVIPKGAQVMYNIYCINRMPSFWGPTAEQYRPERWLDMDAVPSPYSYMTFGAGSRSCLGQPLTELVGVFVLAGLLHRFSFSQVVPGQKIACHGANTMLLKGGLHVYVQKRG